MSGAADALYVRVDASPLTGLGHFTRCFALGQHWRDMGRTVTFVGSYPAELRARLTAEGIGTVAIPQTHPAGDDLPATLEAIPRKALTVLDGYRFDYEYQRSLAADRRLLVIDDIGHLPAYAGAALLNSNLFADDIEYAHAPTRRWLGADYALLRRAFRQQRAHTVRRAAAGKILVSLGGVDAGNHTLDVLRALEPLGARAHARVIVGPLNAHRPLLAAFAADRPWLALLDNPDMSAEIAEADLVIASASSIFFEIAVLATPSVLLATADNQLPVGRAAADLRAAVYAGDARHIGVATLRTLIEDVLGDTERCKSLGAKAGKLVDGDGVERIGRLLGDLR